MFDLHHILAAAAAAVAGLALVFSRKAPPSAATGAGQASGVIVPPAASRPAPDGLTARAAAELIGHEAIVREAYKDSGGVWTWSVGVTDASGHKVERYIDSPQSILYCLNIFVWLLRTKYLPEVIRVLGSSLSEAQLAAALSFHYNTGAIGHASWVDLWKEGQIAAARASFMTWDHPSSIVARRQKECDLFFDGRWSGNGDGVVYPVLKPSYEPDFRHPMQIDVLGPLHSLLGGL